MPMMEGKLKKASDGYICEPQTLKHYQTLLKRIIYLIVKIHPDLAYAIFRFVKFSSNPIDENRKAMKKVYVICKKQKILTFVIFMLLTFSDF